MKQVSSFTAESIVSTTLEQIHKVPTDQPSRYPLPHIADAVRARTDAILDQWRDRALFSIPDLPELTRREFRNDVAKILAALADALESSDDTSLRKLVQSAPDHGFQRFLKDYDLVDVFAEERVLRRVLIEQIEIHIGRQLTPAEAADVHGLIDVMLQQGIVAMIQSEREQLRSINEAELKYLSFISHDLSNNLFVIRLNLSTLKSVLAKYEELAPIFTPLDSAASVVTRTFDGMRAMLAHERLRHDRDKPVFRDVSLREIIAPIVAVAKDLLAAAPGITLSEHEVHMAIPVEARVHTDPNLLTILLQNLIGNAFKHSLRNAGSDAMVTIRIEARRLPRTTGQRALNTTNDRDLWQIAVADNGPGIPPEELDHIFEPFVAADHVAHKEANEPSAHSSLWSIGLGLAIASQSARLLGTSINVQSTVGRGSTFSVELPSA